MHKATRSIGIFRWMMIVLSCLLSSYVMQAQIINPNISGRPADIQAPTDTVIQRPQLDCKYVLSSDLSKTYNYTDTSLTHYIEVPDPGKCTSHDQYVHLGHIGSSAAPLTLIEKIPVGYNMGVTQYDLYYLHKDSMRFYRSNRTVADLGFYKLSGGQSNFTARADYFQEFQNDLSLSINFKRYNYDATYNNASSFNTAFGIGLLYAPKDSSFKSYIKLVNNHFTETHNGGFTDTISLFNAQFKQQVPVALSNSNSRHEHQHLQWHLERNIYNNAFKAFYDISYSRGSYFYGDQSVSSANDSMVYLSYLNDDRGITTSAKDWQIGNTLAIQGSYKDKLDFRVGARHDWISIGQGGGRNRRNDISLIFNGRFNLFKSFATHADGHLGVGSNAGNFLLHLRSQLSLKELVSLEVDWSSYVKEAPLIDQRLYVNGQRLYDNNFAKILGTRLAGSLKFKPAHFTLKVQQHLINNPVYWSETSLPLQSTSLYIHTTGEASFDARLWRFGLRTSGLYQIFSENIYYLPTWYTNHDIHYQGKPFDQKMTLRIGSNVRLIPSGKGRAYQPLTGRFYQSADNPVFYPEWSAYISAQIQTFKIAIIYDNITDWMTPLYNIRVNKYPYYDANLSVSLRWLFLD